MLFFHDSNKIKPDTEAYKCSFSKAVNNNGRSLGVECAFVYFLEILASLNFNHHITNPQKSKPFDKQKADIHFKILNTKRRIHVLFGDQNKTKLNTSSETFRATVSLV